MKRRIVKKLFKKHKDEILKATSDAVFDYFIKSCEAKYPGLIESYNKRQTNERGEIFISKDEANLIRERFPGSIL